LESAEEFRLETLVPENRLRAAIDAMRSVHPYEVPAFDVLPLQNGFMQPRFGRIGRLAEPMTAADFFNQARRSLNTDRLDFVGCLDQRIYRVATAAGAGGEFLEEARKRGADAFITGEIKHHEAQAAAEHTGMIAAAAGHFSTEMPGMHRLIHRLQNELNALQYTIEVIPSNHQRDSLCRYQG
jgi:putative NIF3 family GTP cyclohydrolase 1 type 2